MNFVQAKQKLRKIANGKYFAIEYKEIDFGIAIQPEVVCNVYINGSNWHKAATWEDALKKLEEELNPPASNPDQRPEQLVLKPCEITT